MVTAVEPNTLRSTAASRAHLWLAFLGLTAARWIVCVTALLVLWVLVPVAFGWQAAVVVTGSMEPGLPAGSVILAAPPSAETLRPGVIVLADFPGRSGELLSHRIVRSETDGIVTKGDANLTEDSDPIPASSVQGVVRLVVPVVGQVAMWWEAGAYWHLGAAAGVVLLSSAVVLGDRARSRVGRPGPGRHRAAAVGAWSAVTVAMTAAAAVLVVAPADAAWVTSTRNPNDTWGTASSFVFAYDSFNNRTVSGGLGTAVTGGAWNITSGSSRMSVNNTVANLELASGGDLDSAYLSPTTTADVNLTGQISFSNVPDNSSGARAMLIARRVGTNLEYRARLRVWQETSNWCDYNCESNYRIGAAFTRLSGSSTEAVMGSETTLPYDYDTYCTTDCGTTGSGPMNLMVRVAISGTSPTTLKLKVWRKNYAEPSSWTVSVTDSTAGLQAAGAVGIVGHLSQWSDRTTTVRIHDFLAQKGSP